jgi:drug/metabolite transporter (DMT)-like permease
MLLTYTSPIFLTAIRMIIAGSFLLVYQLVYMKRKLTIDPKNFWLYAQIIFFGIYITYILRFWGLQHLSPSKTAFLFNMSPFFSALYSYFLLNEFMTRKQWAGLAIGFVGLIPILINSNACEVSMTEFFCMSWAELAVLAAVAAHSYSWIIMRSLVKDKSHSPATINGICMTIGGIMALATSLFVENIPHIEHMGTFISLLLAVIIISNIICHNLYGHLLRRYTATFLSLAGFLGPLLTTLYGWILTHISTGLAPLHETITWHFYVSVFIVFIGLYLFYQDELRVITSEEDYTI